MSSLVDEMLRRLFVREVSVTLKHAIVLDAVGVRTQIRQMLPTKGAD